eukprot:1000358-Prymnesium_polylepis.1
MVPVPAYHLPLAAAASLTPLRRIQHGAQSTLDVAVVDERVRPPKEGVSHGEHGRLRVEVVKERAAVDCDDGQRAAGGEWRTQCVVEWRARGAPTEVPIEVRCGAVRCRWPRRRAVVDAVPWPPKVCARRTGRGEARAACEVVDVGARDERLGGSIVAVRAGQLPDQRLLRVALALRLLRLWLRALGRAVEQRRVHLEHNREAAASHGDRSGVTRAWACAAQGPSRRARLVGVAGRRRFHRRQRRCSGCGLGA